MRDASPEAYLDSLAMRNYSDATIKTYRRVYATFPKMYGATVEDAEEWWISRRGLKPRSRRLELAAVRSYYKWQTSKDLRPDDPTRQIDLPKLPKSLPKPIPEEHLAHLVKVLPPIERRAVILGAEFGLRVSEAAAATWDDIEVDGDEATIRVTGKGEKTRIAGSRAGTIDLLGGAGRGNIVTAGGEPLTGAALGKRVRRRMHEAGVKLSHHACRHRYATYLLDSGIPLPVIQQSMGHASPDTTAGYIALSRTQYKGIAAALDLSRLALSSGE